jgi:aminoglycoside phosphotransferase (APT) family kinase protein
VRLAGAPQPLTGGFWATMYRVHVEGQPDRVPSDLVVRIAPDPVMAAKETAVQRALADLGYPTPRVWLERPEDPSLGGSWAVMDFVAGLSPLGDLDGAAALRRAPSLFARLPRLLAEPMARLHAVDPEPVSSAVAQAAPGAAWDVDALLGHFESGAVALDRHDLVVAVGQIADRRPPAGSSVVCHGDLHPFNVLVHDGTATVLDWTAAIRAEPAYDVAFTALLLAHPPLSATGALGAVIARMGRSLARRFVRTYQTLTIREDVGPIDWYTALHGARVLIEGASLGDNVHGHPFELLAPAAIAAIARITDR